MRKGRAWFGDALKLGAACMPLALLALTAEAAQPQAAGKADARRFNELTKTYCVKCHNTEDWAGGVAMDTMDLAHAGDEPEIWEEAVNKLRGRLMPPAGQKQPSQADVDAFVGFLETSLDSTARPRVGHVPLQRLNRTEFAASIKELLGVDIDTKAALPTEVEVEGFSNIASALGVSPAFMEQYMAVARKAVKLAIGDPVPKMAKVTVTTGGQAPPTAYPLGTRGAAGGRGAGMHFTHIFPADGDYQINIPEEDYIDMGLYPRGAEHPATMVILLDGVEMVRKEIGGKAYLDIADRDGPAGKKVILSRLSSTIPVTAGKHEVTVTFIERARSLSNDSTGNGRMYQPVLQSAILVEGPFEPKGRSMNDSRAKVFVCMPKGAPDERPCAETIGRHMATKAFRRPVTDADMKSLMRFYDEGSAGPGGFEAGVSELVTAILSAPDFLYRDIPAPRSGEARLLTDLELATRLSFFMWNTGPDEPLIQLATAKRLSDPAVMREQVARMLKDPRANTLVENFALAWLNLDELDKVSPDGFSAAMRANYETEIRMFLASVLLEDRSVTDLLTADWTFVNESLAQQYGIPGIRGPNFRRVTLANENRWGILGKGAMLLRTSYGSRTSPVLRGAWVLDRIMGTPPHPPPPNVNTDIGVKDGEVPTTVRARLELHRNNATCQACHGIIDPPGLALENFDNQGRWRDVDVQAQRTPIDPNTELSSGQKINGPVELRKYLASHKDQFPTTVTKRLMMYALNREVEYYDMPQVRQIVRNAAASNYRFSDLINGIVNSDAFRKQGPEERKPTVASNTGPAATKP